MTKIEVVDSLFSKHLFDVAGLLYEGREGFVLTSENKKKREGVTVACAAFSKASGKCCALVVPWIDEVNRFTKKIIAEYSKVKVLDVVSWRHEEECRRADVLVMSYEKFNNMLYWRKTRPNIKAVIFYEPERLFMRKSAILKAIIHRLIKLNEKRKKIINYYIITRKKRPKTFLLEHFHHAFWREKLEEKKTIKITNDYEKTTGKTFEKSEKTDRKSASGGGIRDQLSMFLVLISRRRQLKSKLLKDVRGAFPEGIKQEEIVEIFTLLEEKGLIIRKKYVRKQEKSVKTKTMKNGEKTGKENPPSSIEQKVYFFVSGHYQATEIGEYAATSYIPPEKIMQIQKKFLKEFSGKISVESYTSFLCKESKISEPSKIEKILEKLRKKEKLTEKERKKIERLAAPLYSTHKIITESEAYKLLERKTKQEIDERGDLLKSILKAKPERSKKGKRKKYRGKKLVEMVVKCVYTILFRKQKEETEKTRRKNGFKKPPPPHSEKLQFIWYVTVANILNIPKRTAYYVMRRYFDHITPEDPWLKNLIKDLPKRLTVLINKTVEKSCFYHYKEGIYRPQTVLIALI